MRHRWIRGGSLAAAFVVFLSCAASAWAQDYTVTASSGKLEPRPATGVTSLDQTNGNSNVGRKITLPYSFPYYGRLLTTLWISPSGFVLGDPAFSTIFLNQSSTGNAPGRDFVSGAFPYTPLGQNGAANPNADGLIAPFWSNLQLQSGPPQDPNSGNTYWWTVGSAPNRRFVVSWENFKIGTSSNPFCTQIQVHLYETTGRIVFAYDPSSAAYAGSSAKYACGIDAFLDGRFTCPKLSSDQNLGPPGNDFILDPRSVTYTGKLLFDKVVSDASGIGNSTLANQPIKGQRVELRRDGGIVANAVLTAADGSFSIAGLGIASTSTGTMQTVSRNDAANVAPTTGGAALEWTVNGSISYAAGQVIGTQTLGSSGDATGAVRGAFNVAGDCLAVWQWASARTTNTIGKLDVNIDASGAATGYLPAGALPAVMTVGSLTAANPDVWDDAIVSSTYGRHVLASVSAAPTTFSDLRFDAVTDTQNAFAQGFGFYLWGVVSGSKLAIDGRGPSAATVYDLEAPTLSVTRGPDVAGCMAAALFDLADAANETIDGIDGTAMPERVFQRADTFTVTPTASTFLQSWVDAGFDAPSVTRVFVGDGALADDASEPNDSMNEVSSLGQVGVRRAGLTLNRFNEDWFSVTLPSAVPSFTADVTWDRASVAAVLGLAVRDSGGALVATGATVGATGPLRATTGALAAGVYRIGVMHQSGVTVPSYSVQAYLALDMAATPLTDWTVGRDYDQPLGVAGGVPPYQLSTVGSTLPPGLSFSPLTQHAVGNPTTAGTYPVTVQLRDDGNPANVLQRSQSVTIHDVLKIAVPAYVGFPVGKTIATSLPTTGGTPPFVLTSGSGALPAGLTFTPGTFAVTGTADAAGASDLTLDAMDVAGSADHVATRAVACVSTGAPNAAADLAAGSSACGFWFDAVAGSTVGFSAKTAKGRAKRLLAGVVLAPDRSLVAGAVVKGKLGGLSVSKLVCPLSGRYFVIASSDDGEATQILGNAKITPPKSGKAKFSSFDPKDTTEVTIGVLPGGKVTLKFTGDKKAGLTAKVVGLRDPSGTPVTFATFVTAAPFGGTFVMTAATGGTWTVVLGATSGNGNPGKLSWSYSVAQPKGASFVAD